MKERNYLIYVDKTETANKNHFVQLRGKIRNLHKKSETRYYILVKLSFNTEHVFEDTWPQPV